MSIIQYAKMGEKRIAKMLSGIISELRSIKRTMSIVKIKEYLSIADDKNLFACVL
jgi:hypothetical protein